MAYIFTTPLGKVTADDLANYTLNFNFDTHAAKIFATDSTYATSAMDFMTPPNAGDLSRFSGSGGRTIVLHGMSDPVFSLNDTISWVRRRARHPRREGQRRPPERLGT